ncbi:MAG: TRAP transporter substrate-binding protein DctP [Burkholderiaceae bacterium]
MFAKPRDAARHSRRWLALAALSAAVLAPSTAAAQYQIRYASAAPSGSIFAKQVERLAAQIGEESQGKIQVSPFHNSQLGGEADVIGQIARGRIDMGGFSATTLSLQAPELTLLQLPFFFDSEAQRDCVMDNHAKPLVIEALARKGLHFFAWGESGDVQLVGKKSFASPADLKGIKFGHLPSKALSDFARLQGANPIPITSAEIASSLQTGLIDSFTTMPVFYIPAGLNKIAPIMTKLDMSSAFTINVIHKGTYDKWPAEVRAAFDRGVAKTPTSTVRQEVRDLNRQLLKAHTDGGGAVAPVTPAQRAEWQKGLRPYYLTLVKELGASGEKLFSTMEAGKKACAQ